MAAVKKKPARRNVTFELPERQYQLLIESAEEHGVSLHKRARGIVIEHFELSLVRQLLEEQERDRIALDRLAEVVRRAVYVLLTKLTKASSQSVNSWIRKHMVIDPRDESVGSAGPFDSEF